jgi:hypothetical protein|nr:MAG TPA: hypothetical protein [Caudoviricetes sp.]
MNSRPEITVMLSLSIQRHICPNNDPRIYWAREVTLGVYVPDGMNYRGEWYDLKAIKKAKRKDRSRPVSEMLLMMFRSAARDRKKVLSDGH